MCKNLNISKERKNEIDDILKENQKKFENGELKKHSLKEFDEKHEIRKKEFEYYSYLEGNFNGY